MIKIKKIVTKYGLFLCLLSLASMHNVKAVVVKKDQKVYKENKNYSRKELVNEFIQSRYFIPSLIFCTAPVGMMLGASKENEKLAEGSFIALLLSVSRLAFILYDRVRELQKTDVYLSNKSFKLMDPESKVKITSTLFNTLYNHRLETKSYLCTPKEYDRLTEYYSVLQELGLSDEISEMILKEAQIVSASGKLKKIPVKTKQLLKLLKHVKLYPYDKKFKIRLREKYKKFALNKHNTKILRELIEDLTHFYVLKDRGWIHCRKQTDKRHPPF